RISYDECRSWNDGKVLHEGPAAYSDLCIDSDMNISCLYERGERGAYEMLSFAKFDLAWLTDGEDTLK
ncbi:MAG: sialidase family protein, partial [Candidatus Poribacteria bacterium]|nr:sialidase family protein [Candidatus Poribacteria bacterium]